VKITQVKKKHLTYILLFVLAVAIFTVFSNSLTNEFTNWDDDVYITQNPHITDLSISGIKNIFSVYVSCHYHPITLLSLAIDYHFWGLTPKGFLLNNILLHIINSLLFYLFLTKIFKNQLWAFLATILFAVHPFRIESVVWMSERKDVLFAFFYLVALNTYWKFLQTKQLKWLFYVFLLFILSLLSKALAVSLPLILLSLDYYSDRTDFKKILIEKIPFLGIALVFGLIAIDAQSTATQHDIRLIDHFFLATYAVSFYFVKFFAPLYQSAIIPFPDGLGDVLPAKYYLSFFSFLLILGLLFINKNHKKILFLSFSIFLIPLSVILIKFPIGPAFLGERYTYIPYMGLSILLTYVIFNLYEKSTHIKRKLLLIITISFILFLTFSTINRNKIWQNNLSLFTDVVKKDTHVPIAHINLGNIFFEKGIYNKAISHYSDAIIQTDYVFEAYLGRGLSYYYTNLYTDAINDLSIILTHDSTNAKALLYIGLSETQTNQWHNALGTFNKLLNIDSNNIQALNYRGGILLNMGAYVKAISTFDKILKIDNKNALAYFNKGLAYEKQNLFDLALNNYTLSIEADSLFIEAYNSRAVLRGRVFNDLQGALEDINKILNINPLNQSALTNKAHIYLSTGDTLNACLIWQGLINRGEMAYQQIFNLYCNR